MLQWLRGHDRAQDLGAPLGGRQRIRGYSSLGCRGGAGSYSFSKKL
ncbi:hypothetical protein SL1157_0606 [Ruegeria lacuscaerulensis ITI-1157]|nr:hypothetical protein SL1157_0606 [Ruegeria lacuscaerulensis ITI-1157]